ncbi:MAG TPA: response regulator [Paucimonas sp.]|nr:response regulator [Paucimonas sp.]
MKMSFPVCQHPTLVVLVDDSASFIANLEFQMNPSVAVKSFQDTHEALNWIRMRSFAGKGKDLPIRVGYDDQELSLERCAIKLDVGHIYRTVMDPWRFYLSAVIVVDYAMPQMNGLDFCKALAGLPCKKILFTGEADEMVAVEAFNKKLIDRYLRKSDPRALDKLEVEIAALEREYFVERLGTVKDLLVQHSFSFLSDEAFARLASGLAKQYGFVEHFLFPNPPGVLFFDADGKPTLMVVETKIGLVSHLEAAQDFQAPESLQTALKEERIVPFFWKSGGLYTELSEDWEQYCLPAQVCSGREDYYWALFDLPERFLSQPIYPYNGFLRDREWLANLRAPK